MVANQRIVFIGDSITQAGKFEDSEQIGYGYVRYIKDYFVINQPEELPIIFNKGINGNRIPDLEQRWEADVLSLCPNLVSISIGINDVWRQLDHPEWKQVTPVRFREIYDRLLKQVTKNTEASIFLKDYVEVIHQLAERYSATVVPTHQVFIEYLQKQNHQVLTTDGVHMNSAGNMLMAQTWLKAYNKYMEAKKKTL